MDNEINTLGRAWALQIRPSLFLCRVWLTST